jgi:site-specific recombinase XerD
MAENKEAKPESEIVVASASSLFIVGSNQHIDNYTTTTTLVANSTSSIFDQSNNSPLSQNPAAIYLATLRPNGRRAMRYALDTIAYYIATGTWPTKTKTRKSSKTATTASITTDTDTGATILTSPTIPDAMTMPWHTLRYQHTSAVMAGLREHYKPATANLMLAALRGVLSQAENLGQMSADEYRRATKIKAVRNNKLPSGRSLEIDELKELLEVCADKASAAGVRDAAMIAVLYSAGLRRIEVVKLDLKDFNKTENSLTVRGGKGGKDRITYIGDLATQALSEWIEVRSSKMIASSKVVSKATTTDALFCPISKADNVQPRRLTDQAVLYILQQRAKTAGITATFSPHDFRRTFISHLLDAGADIATVQKLAGHASVTTTAQYDRRGEETKRKTAQLLTLPYIKATSKASDDNIEVTSANIMENTGGE